MRQNFNIQKIRVALALTSITIYSLWLLSIELINLPRGYWVTVAFPFAYFAVLFTLLWKPLTDNRSPFIITYCGMQFIRFVVLSIITINAEKGGSAGPVFGKNTYSDSLLNSAGLLMLFELVATAVVINIASRKNRALKEKKEISIDFNSGVYIFCVLASLLMLILVPSIRNGLTIIADFGTEEYGENMTTLTLLAREFFVASKYFLLFVVIKLFFKHISLDPISEKKNKSRFLPLLIILLVCLLVMGLRIGTNRKRIVADAAACILLVFTLFPKNKRFITLFFVVISFGLIVSTTMFRGATESAQTFMSDLFEPASLQSYVCGQYNVACALLTAKNFGSQVTMGTFLYTSARSCFGIGTLVSGMNIPTLSTYYNQVASMGYTYLKESQIVPMVGEGAIYFNNYLAPIFSMISVYFGVLVDRIYHRTSKIEHRFMSIVVAVYLGQAMSLSTNIIINNVSFKLALFLPIVIVANLIKTGKKAPDKID